MTYSELALKQLKESGYRMTQSRKRVLEVLSHTSVAIDAQEIHHHIIKTKNNIDLVTVYRILETLLEEGLVHKIASGYLPCSHSQCSSNWHLITRCLHCGVTSEHHISSQKLQSLQKFLENDLKFKPQKHPFIVDGSCEACSE